MLRVVPRAGLLAITGIVLMMLMMIGTHGS